MDNKLKKGEEMICGVCSGIADWIGIDPVVIRILWLIFTLCVDLGTGIILYVLFSFVMSDE